MFLPMPKFCDSWLSRSFSMCSFHSDSTSCTLPVHRSKEAHSGCTRHKEVMLCDRRRLKEDSKQTQPPCSLVPGNVEARPGTGTSRCVSSLIPALVTRWPRSLPLRSRVYTLYPDMFHHVTQPFSVSLAHTTLYFQYLSSLSASWLLLIAFALWICFKMWYIKRKWEV